MQLMADAAAALVVLLAITTISMYKPWGRARYGLSENYGLNIKVQAEITTKKSWEFYMMIGLTGLVMLFIIKHLLGGGMGGH